MVFEVMLYAMRTDTSILILKQQFHMPFPMYFTVSMYDMCRSIYGILWRKRSPNLFAYNFLIKPFLMTFLPNMKFARKIMNI